MSKAKKFIVLLLTAALAVFLCIFPFTGNVRANAAENGAEPTDDGGSEEDLKTLVDGFLAQLKAKYGEDYETYYNAILSDWGSIEEYLLSLVNEDTPDKTAQGWTAFVKWLGEYSPVWASILAVALVIVVIVCGKKALKKVAEFATGTSGKMKTLFAEINKIDAAQAAQNSALLKLLGENNRFKEERDALEKSAEDLKENGSI